MNGVFRNPCNTHLLRPANTTNCPWGLQNIVFACCLSNVSGKKQDKFREISRSNSIHSSKDISVLCKQQPLALHFQRQIPVAPEHPKLAGERQDQMTPICNPGLNFTEVSQVFAITSHEHPRATKLFWLVGLLFPGTGMIQSDKSLPVTWFLEYDARFSTYRHTIHHEQPRFSVYCVYCHAKCSVSSLPICFSVTYLWVLFSHCF